MRSGHSGTAWIDLLFVSGEIDVDMVAVRVPDVDLDDVEIGNIGAVVFLAVCFEPGFERAPAGSGKREVFEPEFSLGTDTRRTVDADDMHRRRIPGVKPGPRKREIRAYTRAHAEHPGVPVDQDIEPGGAQVDVVQLAELHAAIAGCCAGLDKADAGPSDPGHFLQAEIGNGALGRLREPGDMRVLHMRLP